jgi:hypothetical protein
VQLEVLKKVTLTTTTTKPEQQAQRKRVLEAAHKVLMVLGHNQAKEGLMFEEARDEEQGASVCLIQKRQLWEQLVKAMGTLVTEADKEVRTLLIL